MLDLDDDGNGGVTNEERDHLYNDNGEQEETH